MLSEHAPLRLALVDDHPVTLLGLRTLLKDWPHGTLVLDATSGRAYQEAVHHQP